MTHQIDSKNPLRARRGRTARMRRCGAIALVGVLTGCAAGPDYVRPALPTAGSFPEPRSEQIAAAPVAGGTPQRFVRARDIAPDWWTLLRSPQLNALVDKALATHPSIESAQAALRGAQENVAAQRGFFLPTVGLGYTPSRTKLAGNLGGNSPGVQQDGSVISTYSGTPAKDGGTPPFNGPVTYTFHTAQLTVGYVPDIFGANRRQVEALQAQAQFQRYQLEAARLALASNVAAAAIQDAMLRRQISTVRAMIDAAAASVDLVRRQQKAGYASGLDMANQESALAQARQLLPPLSKQFEQNRDLLRALTGASPDLDPPGFDLDMLQLPVELPLSLPSQLVEQRPDVRAAEELLRAATAQVGVARANRLPQFSINATAGGAAGHLSQMFGTGGQFFDFALNVTEPLFAGGTLLHRERAAREAMRQAVADYRSTVITAFQNVADVLHAIEADTDAFQATADSVQAAQSALDLTRRQYGRGYLDRLAMINAEQAYRQAALNATQARAARYGDSIALFVALGGGWWGRVETSASD
jgi:NodT family efflux transporter outer membrane factor (OMF) lipoprotein